MNKAELKQKMTAAMKAKDSTAVAAIRAVLSAVQYEELQKEKDELEPPELLEIIGREQKKRKEELEFLDQANRFEQAATVKREIAVLENLLPEKLSESQLETIVKEFFSENPEANMGEVMKMLRNSYQGQYDGATASKLVKGHIK